MRPVSVRNEEGEQIAVCDWLRWHQLVFLHVPNEAKRSQAAGHLQKLMGLQKGFPDLLVLEPRGRYHGLAIEMKAIGGRVRPEQKEWIETLRAKDYAAEIAYGADHAISIIEEYLKKNSEIQVKRIVTDGKAYVLCDQGAWMEEKTNDGAKMEDSNE